MTSIIVSQAGQISFKQNLFKSLTLIFILQWKNQVLNQIDRDWKWTRSRQYEDFLEKLYIFFINKLFSYSIL